MAKKVENSAVFLWILLVGASITLILPVGEQVEAKFGLSQLMRWRGIEPPPAGTAVIAITEDTADTLGLPKVMTEWSRQIYADLVHRLQQMGVKTVVFDIFFAHELDEQGDLSFANAIKNHGNVILFAYAERTIRRLSNSIVTETDRLLEPVVSFQKAAQRTAPFVLPKVPAQVSSFVIEHAIFPPRKTMPAVALEISQHAIWASYAKSAKKRYWYNFYGPPQTVTTIPLEKILSGNQPLPVSLAGYTVFVGYSSLFQPDQDDGFQTAFTSSGGHDISGVELAATAYANLRDNVHSQKGPFWLWPVIGLSYALLGLLIARNTERYTLPCLLLLGCFHVSLSFFLFKWQAFWLPWLIPVFGITPVLAVYGYQRRVHKLQVQRKTLEGAFGRYLPASEIDELLKNPQLKMAEQKLFGVCMVTDAEGYTRVAEKLGALKLSELMHEYLATIINPIRQSGGIISDVAGDGVIAVWPHLNRESAFQTTRPVIRAIQQGVEVFNNAHSDTPLPTRIGVHAGELVLGHFGAADHFEYRAIGDIVNTASRIEGANKKLGTRVLVSGNCLSANHAKHLPADLRYLGSFLLPGKSSAIPLYTVVTEARDDTIAEDCNYFYRYQLVISQLEQGNLAQAKHMLDAVRKDYPEDRIVQFLWEWINQPEYKLAAYKRGIYLG